LLFREVIENCPLIGISSVRTGFSSGVGLTVPHIPAPSQEAGNISLPALVDVGISASAAPDPPDRRD
jgi:hypothetical protein